MKDIIATLESGLNLGHAVIGLFIGLFSWGLSWGVMTDKIDTLQKNHIETTQSIFESRNDVRDLRKEMTERFNTLDTELYQSLQNKK